MNPWDLWTWVAIVVLGPGAILIFVAFLRDAKKLFREIATNERRE